MGSHRALGEPPLQSKKKSWTAPQPVVGPCICSSDTDVNFCKKQLTPKFQRRLLKKQIDFFFRVSLLSNGARWTWHALQGPNRNLAKRFSFLYASFPLMSLSRRAAVLHSLFGRNYSYQMLRTSTHPSLFICLNDTALKKSFLKLFFGQPGDFECFTQWKGRIHHPVAPVLQPLLSFHRKAQTRPLRCPLSTSVRTVSTSPAAVVFSRAVRPAELTSQLQGSRLILKCTLRGHVQPDAICHSYTCLKLARTSLLKHNPSPFSDTS